MDKQRLTLYKYMLFNSSTCNGKRFISLFNTLRFKAVPQSQPEMVGRKQNRMKVDYVQ